jgi:hypothetical protein
VEEDGEYRNYGSHGPYSSDMGGELLLRQGEAAAAGGGGGGGEGGGEELGGHSSSSSGGRSGSGSSSGRNGTYRGLHNDYSNWSHSDVIGGDCIGWEESLALTLSGGKRRRPVSQIPVVPISIEVPMVNGVSCGSYAVKRGKSSEGIGGDMVVAGESSGGSK